MSLESIAHYRITGKLGEGGMGAVYRATDTKLNRDVAVKVLHDAFAHDADRLMRFTREAQVLASLSHPNIASIFGIEEHAIVMELVEGPTLADRIEAGKIPQDEALRIACHVAEALEAAHEKNVIHRDLKPANIKVTPEGTVKVLDFGLAKLADPRETAEKSHLAPTIVKGQSPTMAGMIMGTAEYMSPEQAAGKPVDKRTDIWAFGVVLWEMLAGRRMFTGENVVHILADVLRAPIDLSGLPNETPQAIRGLLLRCLDRDMKSRLRDIGEARLAIEKYLANPASDAVPSTRPAASAVQSKTAWAAAAVMGLIAAIGGVIWWSTSRPIDRPLIQLEVDLGADVSLGSPVGPNVILSPDGSRLVFVSKSRLLTRRLDQPKAIELPGTEGAFAPFFSPDGQWIAFFAASKLKKISVEGGSPIVLCDVPSGRGGTWGEDHNIIASLDQGSGLSLIPDTGGVPQPLTEITQRESRHRWPQILPGGKAVLFTASSSMGVDGRIEVLFFKDRRRVTVQQGAIYGRYVPGPNRFFSSAAGHLLYVSKSTLFAVPFDPDTATRLGTAAQVLQDVANVPVNGSAQFDFSQSGTLVYRNGGDTATVTLQWLDGAGKLQPLSVKSGHYGYPRISPDGKLVALTEASEGSNNIVTYDWQRDAKTRVAGGVSSNAVWSQDGRYLVFRSETGISWARADGSSNPEPLTNSKFAQIPSSYAPDGKRLAFTQQGSNGLDIWIVPVEDNGKVLRAGQPEAFLQTPANEMNPAFSPDGRWIAYRSFESGTGEIYVRSFPDNGSKWQVSNSGGVVAVWAPNGRELFWRTTEQQIMVAGYTVKGDSFVPDKPRLWSERRLADTSVLQNMDIAPDGKRLLVLMPAEGPEAQRSSSHVTFLLNFFDEVRRRAPQGK
ncbi:MAG: protein kinase [Bryobacteraceae bacterium]